MMTLASDPLASGTLNRVGRGGKDVGDKKVSDSQRGDEGSNAMPPKAEIFFCGHPPPLRRLAAPSSVGQAEIVLDGEGSLPGGPAQGWLIPR